MVDNRFTPRRVVFLCAGIFALAALSSCFSPFKRESGNLVINFSTDIYDGGKNYSARAVDWTGITLSELNHTVSVSDGPGPDQSEDNIKDGGNVTFDVAVGNWKVAIEGFDDTTLKSYGETRVDVYPGQTTRARIEMKRVETEEPLGDVTIEITTAAATTINTLYLAGGEEITEGEEKVTIDWGNGSPAVLYDLKASSGNLSLTMLTQTYKIANSPNDAGTTGLITIKGKISGFTLLNNSAVTGLKVAEDAGLYFLDCSDSEIVNLDVTKSTALRYLYCGFNEIETLNLENNTKLWELQCNDNNLRSIDVSHSPELIGFFCNGNDLEGLDVTGNPALTNLVCYDNYNLFSLILDNRDLSYLACNNTILNALDVSNCPALKTLICANTKIAALDVRSNRALTGLNCSANPNLARIEAGQSSAQKGVLNNIQMNECPLLAEVNLSFNNLSTVSTTGLSGLTTLDVTGNGLGGIDLSDNTALINLSCGQNRITGLDLSQNAVLKFLDCNRNSLEGTLNLSANQDLEKVSCDDNGLEGINISGLTKLNYFWCRRNQITGTLDLTANENLIELCCENNHLTDIKVAGLDALNKLNFHYNDVDTVELVQIVQDVCTVTGSKGTFNCANNLGEPELTAEQIEFLEGKNWEVIRDL